MSSDWAQIVYADCLASTSRDPLAIAMGVMGREGFPVAGQAHHGLVAGALTAAYQNAIGRRDEKMLEAAIKRADSLPGGFCAGFGADVGAIAAGVVVSVIHGNTIRAEHSPTRALAHQLTAQSLLTLANNSGNRCCKRTVFQVLEAATNFFRANLGVELDRAPAASLRCPYAVSNELCNREACRYYDASVGV
jgi:hypothetical protein